MRVIKAILLITLLIPFVLVASYYIWKWIDNARFAANLFDDKVEVVRVVASKGWMDFSEEWRACSYAVVEFSEATANTLRVQGPKALVGKWGRPERHMAWHKAWKATPAEEPEASTLYPFRQCLKELPKKEATLIWQGLKEAGSWYYGDGLNVKFLSARHRLAAALRYGD